MQRLDRQLPAVWRAYLALGAGILAIGLSPVLVRDANAPGVVTSFYRMAIGALLMGLPFARQIGKVRGGAVHVDEVRRGVLMAMLGGAFFAFDLALWSTGIVLSGATNPTLMSNTAPLWVGLGSWLIFRERQNGRFWAGLLLAMVGAVIVLGQDLTRAAEFGLGTFLGLLAAFFYGAYYLVTQRGRSSLGTVTYFWIATASAAVFFLLTTGLLRQPLTGYDVGTYVNFVILGVVVQVMGWSIINYAQGYLPAAIVAPTLLGQPVVTAVLAVLLLGERFTPGHLVGGTAVLAGVYIVHWSRRTG